MLMCRSRGIQGVCSWKRTPQQPEINESLKKNISTPTLLTRSSSNQHRLKSPSRFTTFDHICKLKSLNSLQNVCSGCPRHHQRATHSLSFK